MRSFNILLLSTLLSIFASAQVNPYGFKLTIDGKLEFAEHIDFQYAPRITDTAFIYCAGDTSYIDFNQFMHDNMVILEPSSPEWTDYSSIEEENKEENYEDFLLDITTYQVVWDTNASITQELSPQTQIKKNHFEDVLNYHGEISDSTQREIKKILNDYIQQNKQKDITWKNWYALRTKLSEEDELKDKEPVYDYILDKAVFFEYTEDRLTRVIGYFFNSGGVENDTLVYDRRGNLIYFHRETIGIAGEEFYFTYNWRNKLTKVKHLYYHYNSNYYDACPSCINYSKPSIHKYKYKRWGNLKSITTQNEYHTGTCYFSFPNLK